MGSPFDLVDPPVYALTSRHRDREDAMIATWVLSVTLLEDRGRILVALSPDHLSSVLIVRTRRFVANLLAEGQHGWIPRFGLTSGRFTDKLAGIDVGRTSTGLAILPDTCGYADCEVGAIYEMMGRVIVAAAIVDSESAPEKTPLTLGAAYRALPRETVAACEAQRKRDGLADAVL